MTAKKPKNENSKLKNQFKKWSVLIFLLVFLTTLQCSTVLNINNSVKPILIFPMAVSYFMFNKIKNSIAFAVVCGFFMDCFSERAFGFSSLFFLGLCILISFFCKRFMQTKFLNFIFLNSTFLLLFELLNFIILYISLNFKNIWPIWLSHIFPTCALTILVSPIFYLTFSLFYRFVNKKKLIATTTTYSENYSEN